MWVQKSMKRLFLYYMLGFVAGIFYANLLSKAYLSESGIFNEYFLCQYVQTDINVREYLFYLLQVRLLPLSLLGVIGYTRMRKAAVLFWLGWTGFSSGILSVASVLKMGIRGAGLCLIGMFPHMLFYGAAYLILIWCLYRYPEVKWNMTKAAAIVILMGCGILLEAYVNPQLIRWFAGLM